MRIGIAGTGGIGRAYAAFLASRGHDVALWSPLHRSADAMRSTPLVAAGILDCRCVVAVADTAEALAGACDVVIIAVPANGHRTVIDALAPYMRDGMSLFVSATASLSALYAHEQLARLGRKVTVAASGTTMLTARAEGANSVRILTRRQKLGLCALPGSESGAALALWSDLFGDVFTCDANALASTLSNVNPVSHGPLALFNWTRIERAEAWPLYHCMTPDVSRVITALDHERMAVASAFGLTLRSITGHFAASFGVTAPDLAGIAAELHARRGGPPGPTDTATRFITEDIPFGLVVTRHLAAIAGVACPATETIIDMVRLITGQDLAGANDLIAPLGLEQETRAGLLQRVGAMVQP